MSAQPEHVLAGIDICGTKDVVIAKHGHPDHIVNHKINSGTPMNGERDYLWRRSSTTLSGATEYYFDKNGKEVESDICEIEVAGSSPAGDIGMTGAGLLLGDTRARANQIYGPHFRKSEIYKSSIRGNHVPVLAIEWENGTRLCIAFDKQGRINFMALAASHE